MEVGDSDEFGELQVADSRDGYNGISSHTRYTQISINKNNKLMDPGNSIQMQQPTNKKDTFIIAKSINSVVK